MSQYEIASVIMSSLSLGISLMILVINYFKSRIKKKLIVVKILNLGSKNFQYTFKLINKSQNLFTIFATKNCELLNNEDILIKPYSTNLISLIVVFSEHKTKIRLQLLTTKGKIKFKINKPI